jgi:hypothetical protein
MAEEKLNNKKKENWKETNKEKERIRMCTRLDFMFFGFVFFFAQFLGGTAAITYRFI